MVTKTITVTEDAYDFLKRLKTEDESFSRLFIRLAKERSIADKYFGILEGKPENAQKALRDIRTSVSKDFKKRQNELARHIRSH